MVKAVLGGEGYLCLLGNESSNMHKRTLRATSACLVVKAVLGGEGYLCLLGNESSNMHKRTLRATSACLVVNQPKHTYTMCNMHKRTLRATSACLVVNPMAARVDTDSSLTPAPPAGAEGSVCVYVNGSVRV